MFDITIIGAGPAGSTLARLIGDKYRVLLVDGRKLKAVSPGPGDTKSCGGLLAPDAQAILSEMGLGLPKTILVGVLSAFAGEDYSAQGADAGTRGVGSQAT